METKPALTASYTKKKFWYQQFDLRQLTILGTGQPFVDFDAIDYCSLLVGTMEARNFQDDLLSSLVDDFRNH